MGRFIVCLAFLALINGSYGANILFLNGMPSPSHFGWNGALIEGLAAKGYNLTVLSVDIDKKQRPNIHYIHLEKTYSVVHDSSEAIDLMEFATLPPIPAIWVVSDFLDQSCEGNLDSEGLKVILNYPDDFKFDAVIYDMTCGPCLLPLVHKFNNPPLIAVTAFNNPSYTTYLVGGQKHPAFVPHYTVNYLQQMNYFERFYNTVLYAVDYISWQCFLLPKMEKRVRERLNFMEFPPLKKLQQQTALLLVNSDNALDFPEPLQPNMIQVAGLQIREPKALPEDIKHFIEGGKKGTVLMSLGTNILSTMLSEEVKTAIIKTFAQFPDYNFLWKFEAEESELPVKLSKNVMLKKFTPQNDVLAHPNLKLFITHGGLLSTQESIWHGKPMVGIPFFCDQQRTVENSCSLGASEKIDFQSLDVNVFKKAIKLVLEDKKYWQKTQQLSKLFRDKPQKPLDKAIWWIEYAIRNPTTHLKSPTLKLGQFASRSYDVILTIVVAFHILVFMIFKIFKKIFRSSKKTDKKHKSNDNKKRN